MNPARREGITLLLGCCNNEALHSRTNSTLRTKWRTSMLDKDCGGSTTAYWQGSPNWCRIFSTFKRMAPFVQVDIERFVRTVNSQTETDDQEWCTSATSVAEISHMALADPHLPEPQLTRAIASSVLTKIKVLSFPQSLSFFGGNWVGNTRLFSHATGMGHRGSYHSDARGDGRTRGADRRRRGEAGATRANHRGDGSPRGRRADHGDRVDQESAGHFLRCRRMDSARAGVDRYHGTRDASGPVRHHREAKGPPLDPL